MSKTITSLTVVDDFRLLIEMFSSDPTRVQITTGDCGALLDVVNQKCFDTYDMDTGPKLSSF